MFCPTLNLAVVVQSRSYDPYLNFEANHPFIAMIASTEVVNLRPFPVDKQGGLRIDSVLFQTAYVNPRETVVNFRADLFTAAADSGASSTATFTAGLLISLLAAMLRL